jgi:aryl-alcohol dehydrogenase-like predicted oxidoreductase
MQTRRLGHSGIEVSTLALGTMMFGSWGNEDLAECHRMVHRALDAGITLFDTADIYDDGVSETILGQALHGHRDSVILATKVGNQMNNDPQRRGLSRRWIIQACEDSLLRLGVEHIDLYQMHRPDVDTPIEESLQALNDLVKTGKVRAVGTSTFSVGQLIEARAGADALGIAPPSAEQPRTRCSRGAGRTMSACSPGRR